MGHTHAVYIQSDGNIHKTTVRVVIFEVYYISLISWASLIHEKLLCFIILYYARKFQNKDQDQKTTKIYYLENYDAYGIRIFGTCQ